MDMVKIERDYKISIIRFIAMTMIVLCHFMQYYDCLLAWWLNVGVQIFLCLSGILYSQKNIKNDIVFIFKNFIKILVDYYFFIFVALVFYYIFARSQINVAVIFNLLLCNVAVSGLNHLWFINCILFCYLLTPLLAHLLYFMESMKLLGFLFSGFVIMVCVELLMREYINGISPAWINCYILGFLLGKVNIKYGARVMNGLIISLLILTVVSNICQIYISYFRKSQFVGKRLFLYNIFCSYAHVVLGVTIFLLLYKLLEKLHFDKSFRLVELSDKYSYDVYLVHHIFILGALNLESVFKIRCFNIILILAMIVISSYLLNKMSFNCKRKILSNTHLQL